MDSPITAAMLYDLVACPHRVTMDLYGNPSERDQVNPFVELLWERGSRYEREVIANLKAPFIDLHEITGDDKSRLTLEAMKKGEGLIYGGRIQTEMLLGEPDLLRKEGHAYIAGDIKSGSAEEGPEDDSKPKIHYAVQLGLYTDILERQGLSAGRRAFVWDIHGTEAIYDFCSSYGKRNPRTLWEDYQDALQEATQIARNRQATLPAYAGVCKLCHWYSACVKRLRETDDLTMIPELGRSKRDAMYSVVQTVSALAAAKTNIMINGTKTVFPGIGPETLLKFQDRAKLLSTKNATPFARATIQLPPNGCELFFDIEVDPMRDVCYLHGFVERRNGDVGTERFISYFAESPTAEAERDAFAKAVAYMTECRPTAIYYYSKYERTAYRKLQAKYPDVCTAEAIEALFNPLHAVDLYSDVVKKATEWPTWDFSIKTIAKFLGFSWRDTHPSGAASIEWFDKWVASGDPAIRQRILDYNEDDCRAMRVLRDALCNLPIRQGAAQ
ncbi:MAG: TM0106 family RecB-like putative nuclease [Planctomycetes bacterium]|nr:TM0106 family RecB-like putative nuclease [Planctomycetota bacterium]